MKEVLEFIFQSGWHYFGILFLVLLPAGLLANAISGGRTVNVSVIVQDGDGKDEEDEK